MQTSLDNFLARPIPVEGWAHERDGMGWIYRSNAEAVVHDLNRMPSGMGIWPRIMPHSTRGGHRDDGWDLDHWQCRGGGAITKQIRVDGTVRDFLRPIRPEYVDGKPVPETRIRHPLSSAHIDGDELILETEDGRLWSEIIVPDSECRNGDVHLYDPEDDPEHFLIACLHAGITGGELLEIADLPCRFDIISPFIPAMDTVMRLSERIGVIPRMPSDVRHITDFVDIAPVDKTCDRCLKHRKGGGCQSGIDRKGWTDCDRAFYWNGKPFPKRTRKTAVPACCDEEGCEA